MNLLRRLLRKKPKVKTPAITGPSNEFRGLWWNIFANVLCDATDDPEGIQRLRRSCDYANELAAGARNLADAAMREVEDRFGRV